MTGPTHRAHDTLAAAIATQGGEWTATRAATLLTTAGCVIDRNSVWGLLRHLLERPEHDTQLCLFTA